MSTVVASLKEKIEARLSKRKELAKSTLELAVGIQKNRESRRVLSTEIKDLRKELRKAVKEARATVKAEKKAAKKPVAEKKEVAVAAA